MWLSTCVWAFVASTLLSIVNTKAAVFPVPDCDWAIMLLGLKKIERWCKAIIKSLQEIHYYGMLKNYWIFPVKGSTLTESFFMGQFATLDKCIPAKGSNIKTGIEGRVSSSVLIESWRKILLCPLVGGLYKYNQASFEQDMHKFILIIWPAVFHKGCQPWEKW